MKIKSLILSSLTFAAGAFMAQAADVTVKLNKVSTSMSVVSKTSGEDIAIGPLNTGTSSYTFEADPGNYVLTAIDKDGSTVNGTIEFTVAPDEQTKDLLLITCTAYVSNKDADNRQWNIDDGDYTLEVDLSTREGDRPVMTTGKSTTANRSTFLAFEGHTYYASFIPSAKHRAEGYTTLYKTGTLNWNVNVNGTIPIAEDYVITAPKNAYFELNIKFAHFIDFTWVEPTGTVIEGDAKKITYHLAQGQQYNYRTSMEGGLTQGGYFTFSKDASKRPVLEFSKSDYEAFGPKEIKHSVNANENYETGDIFVNINPRGHLVMQPGETFKAHSMRTWQLTENSTNNYFIEPDFHYTVIGLDGRPCDNVISIKEKQGSAWADIEAIGNGTAIVLVTYDAIGLNQYSGSEKKPYMGGEYWGAIWPENTAAYVVTVGQGETAMNPNMTVNEQFHQGELNGDLKSPLKLAGDFVDAEHDVFYYLDTDPGHEYTFKPEGVENVTIAYPSIGENMATYAGFGTEGVTKNDDGSYTLLLKEGRQIVRLTDASGRSVYQVMTARPCHREIINMTREGSRIFQPGDQVKIQYSGLRHPANKIAGIYNMSAYVTYNGVPNGTSLILSANQYTFGGVPSAQAVTFNIPDDHDVAAEPQIVMNEGVIQVNGYGDPIGNHRNIDPVAGRSPNFTAIAHKTYFGYIPDVAIDLTAVRNFDISVVPNIEGADITVSFDGQPVEPAENGLYHGTYGIYSVHASKTGYRSYNRDFFIGDDADGVQTFAVNLVEADGAWDGKTMTEPGKNENSFYVITSPDELAWFADHVNGGAADQNAVLVDDIDLGDFDWTPIGLSYSKSFTGTFTGNKHHVKGLYINKPSDDYQGLFGYAKGTAAAPASITGVIVGGGKPLSARSASPAADGSVIGNRYVAGVLGCANAYVTVDTCANYASVSGTGRDVAGIVGWISQNTSKVLNCYNAGDIDGKDIHAGVVGTLANKATVANVFNVGSVTEGKFAAACVGSTNDKSCVVNSYAVTPTAVESGHELVTDSRMESGEVAFRLGKAFGQTIGTDPHPVFDAPEVLYDADKDLYYNEGTTGVDSIDVDASTVVVYYNLQGVPSVRPYAGLNIVRMADGSCRKIFIP